MELTTIMSEQLCLDLIDEAKVATDAETKVQKLGQIKEIIMNRNPNLLRVYAPEVMDFMSQQTVKIRKFLIQFASEAFSKDKTMVAQIVVLFNYYMSDSSENVLKPLLSEYARLYQLMVLEVSALRQVGEDVDPIAIWHQLQGITTFCIGVISSKKSEELRTLALRCGESILM